MKKAFFYGDSNTFGYDPADYYGGRYPRPQRWSYLLEKALQGEWEVVEDGMPGRVIPAAGVFREYLGKRLMADMPMDLFGVMLGTNDFLGTKRPSAAKTAREMDGFITFLRELGIEKILLIAPPKIELTDRSFEASYVEGDRSYAQLYRDEGQGAHAALQRTGGAPGTSVCGRVVVGSGFCLRRRTPVGEGK